jgi:predicted MFS family arabinose efflux permease
MTNSVSSYRWVIEALLFVALFSQTLTWYAPAPLLGPIMTGLRISLAKAGLVISIIAACVAIFALGGSVVMERLGAFRAFALGAWLMSAGEVLSSYCGGLGELLACRVLEGVGFGLMVAPPGALVMQWFAEREWPYVNMANVVCSYVALTVVYAVTPAVFLALGSSWRRVFRGYGLGCAVVALGWTMLGGERKGARAGIGASRRSALGEAIRMRGVALIAAAMFGGMWVFQLYAAFMPQYFHHYRHLSLAQSSALTALLPLTGIFAAVGGGLATGISGLRKPFTWPLSLCALIGAAGAILAPSLGLVRASLILAGAGAAGSLAAIVTTLMEQPGMTPERVGAGLAFVWAMAYVGAFIAPFLGGAVAGAVGLKATMLGFLAFQLIPVVTLYILPETGPGWASRALR